MNNDFDGRPAPGAGTIGHDPGTPSAPDSSPTFTAEAASLLKHLRLGAPRADAPARAPGAFPLLPDYECECELGRGGMGVVYKARHAALHHTVAIKMILASAHAAPGEVARFVAEAEAVAAVKHPNVVQVYHLGAADGHPYFVMELVAGGNLAGLLVAETRLDPVRAAALIGAVAGGVQAAHDAGIVHRDLKPANILLAVGSGQWAVGNPEKTAAPALPPLPTAHCPLPTPIPKVSDFGLAKRLASDLTRSQAVLGTPGYMAPEQACGKAKFVGPQADVYALGVILYECLTGRLPFTGDPWSLVRQVLEDAPTPVRSLAPGVPRDLELICLKCLEKEPHHRYPTAAALADDLDRFRRGEPVSVRPLGAVTRAARWARKRPARAALFALGAVLLVAVPALAVGVQGRLDRRTAVAAEAQKKEEAAHRAREAAERLAGARELFALEGKLRSRAAARPLGWTAATRGDLPRALALANGDPQRTEDFRSVAATALLTPDLFPLPPVADVLSAAALATDPRTGQIAVGEMKGWVSCRVLLVDPATGKTVRTLTFPTTKLGTLLDPIPDGTRALAFSPDGTRLYVGTRASFVMRFDLDSRNDTPVAQWKAASNAVEQLAVSPDGKKVYGLCRPEVPVFAWDADTGARAGSQFPDDAAPLIPNPVDP